MRVSVLINGKAGYANRLMIEEAVKKALFRCDLRFFNPETSCDMQDAIVQEAASSDVLMICGGDGTLNAAIQPLMGARQHIERFPTICPVPVGTANDLARELGISQSIERAARLALEGQVKRIDVLEIEAGGKCAYMITNGGLGLPAETAGLVNEMRTWIIQQADLDTGKAYSKALFEIGKRALKAVGPRIYELTLAGKMATWNSDTWQCEIEMPGREPFLTRAPFVMINNQKGLGANYTPAPLTYNADGTFNIMLLASQTPLQLGRSLLQVRAGQIPDPQNCQSFETESCTIRSSRASRPLIFFGDGEILHQDVREIHVRCLAGELPVFVKGSVV